MIGSRGIAPVRMPSRNQARNARPCKVLPRPMSSASNTPGRPSAQAFCSQAKPFGLVLLRRRPEHGNAGSGRRRPPRDQHLKFQRRLVRADQQYFRRGWPLRGRFSRTRGFELRERGQRVLVRRDAHRPVGPEISTAESPAPIARSTRPRRSPASSSVSSTRCPSIITPPRSGGRRGVSDGAPSNHSVAATWTHGTTRRCLASPSTSSCWPRCGSHRSCRSSPA